LFAGFTPQANPSLLNANGIEDRAAMRGGAEVWNFSAEICPEDQCQAVRPESGRVVWRDKAHISVATSESLIHRTSQLLATDG